MSAPIRDRLLEAAKVCFSRQGYAGTTIAEICQTAEVAPATFYRHFRSKKILFDTADIATLPDAADSPRRKEILETALELFSRQGYQTTTMSEIARFAGVARATLYTQFLTKEAILSELLIENPVVELVNRLKVLSDGADANDPLPDLEMLALQFLIHLSRTAPGCPVPTGPG